MGRRVSYGISPMLLVGRAPGFFSLLFSRRPERRQVAGSLVSGWVGNAGPAFN